MEEEKQPEMETEAEKAAAHLTFKEERKKEEGNGAAVWPECLSEDSFLLVRRMHIREKNIVKLI